MLAAAAVVLIVAGSTLMLLPAGAAAAPNSLAESAGIPAPLVALAGSTRTLTADELVSAFDSMAVSPNGR
jgi:hypothetical protein